MDDLDHLLAGGYTLQYLGADGTLPDFFNEILDYLEIYVSLKEHQAHFTEGFLDVLFGHYSLTAELFKDQIKFIGKVLKHQNSSVTLIC